MTKRPSELEYWIDEHLSDGALAAIADAAPGVPDEALAHADRCEACSTRLATAALSAMDLHVGLREAARGEAPLSAPLAAPFARPSARRALLVGAALVLVSTLPTLPAVARWLGALLGSGRLWVDALSQVLRALRGATSGAASVWALSLILLALGVAVAVWSSRLSRMNGAEHEAR